jgi:sec-independent protein translocase protein TatA
MPIPLLFDISGGELIVVLLFVLLFFGSKGIPDIARTLGRTMRQVRDASQEVQREIRRGTSEVQNAVEQQRRAMLKDLEEPGTPAPPSPPQPPAPGEPLQP